MALVDYTVISFVGDIICEKRNYLKKARNVLVSVRIVNEKLDRR